MIVAKMSETLDRLSGGRLILPLGAGGDDRAAAAFGLPERSPRDKVGLLGEAIDIIRGLWSQATISHNGQYWTLRDASINPRSSRAIPIWLGVHGDKMVDLLARKGDGWIPSYFALPPEAARRRIEVIKATAAEAGRNPDEIALAYNVPVRIDPNVHTSSDVVAGSAERVAAELVTFVRAGFNWLNLWPIGPQEAQREMLAGIVIPLVRHAL